MESALSLLIGVVAAAATFLLLQRNLLRQVFGIMLLGAGVNLLILTVGRVTRMTPPLIPDGESVPPD
ncbi:MAG: NADH-quinone oxidoreductase subunit K, partial [Planctomycetota bacterium]